MDHKSAGRSQNYDLLSCIALKIPVIFNDRPAFSGKDHLCFTNAGSTGRSRNSDIFS